MLWIFTQKFKYQIFSGHSNRGFTSLRLYVLIFNIVCICIFNNVVQIYKSFNYIIKCFSKITVQNVDGIKTKTFCEFLRMLLARFNYRETTYSPANPKNI